MAQPVVQRLREIADQLESGKATAASFDDREYTQFRDGVAEKIGEIRLEMKPAAA